MARIDLRHVANVDGDWLVDTCCIDCGTCRDIAAAMGGIAHVLLTHRDDVADASRWAERSGARMWIHTDDHAAAS